MVCSKCGAFMPDLAAFCTECGAKLEMQKPSTTVPQFDDDDKTVYTKPMPAVEDDRTVYVNPGNFDFDDEKTVYVNPVSTNYEDDRTVYVNPANADYDDDKTVYVGHVNSNYDDDKTVYVDHAGTTDDDDKTVYIRPGDHNYDDDKTVYVNRGNGNDDDDKTVYINSGRQARDEKILGAKRGFPVPDMQAQFSGSYITGTVSPLNTSGSKPVDKRTYLSVYATSAVRSKSQMELVLTVICMIFMIASCVIAMVAPGEGLPMVELGNLLTVVLLAGVVACLAATGFGGFLRSTVLLVVGTLLAAVYCLIFCGVLFLLLSLVLHAVTLVITMQLNKEYDAYCKSHQ